MTVSCARSLGGSAAESVPRAPRTGMHAYSWLSLLVGGTLALGGCSALLDTEQKQCSVVEDCNKLFGTGTPYSCEDSFCVRPACVQDSDCKGLGFATSVCAGDKRCQSGCTSDPECGEGNVCDLATNRCKGRECTVRTDCPVLTPTVECVNSICVDASWGCIGDPDDRPAATMSKATVKFPFVEAGSRAPILGATARACSSSLLSDTCTAIAGTTAVQDPVTGDFTITGITQNTVVRIAVEPPAGSAFLPADVYSQMPYRDVTTLPAVTTVTRATLDLLTSAFQDPVIANKPGNGGLIGLAFDCEGKTAAGVTFTLPKAITDMGVAPYFTTLVYFSGIAPNPSATSTSGNGLVTGINFPPTLAVPVTMSVSGNTVSTGTWKFLGDRVTTVFFHPRNYGGV